MGDSRYHRRGEVPLSPTFYQKGLPFVSINLPKILGKFFFSIFSTVFTTFSTISVRTKNCFLRFSVPFYDFQYYFRSFKTRFLVPFFVCSLVPSAFAQCFPPDYFDLAATKYRQQDTHLSDKCSFLVRGVPLRPPKSRILYRAA